MKDYAEFFKNATGFEPYPYQQRLVEGAWPDLLNVPTGLGKTAAVTLAWLYRRRHLQESDMPRRLVWCLPMRVLVEQTADTIRDWLCKLGISGEAGDGKVSVRVLMGGADDLKSWSEHPEEDMILIGTQDMLLSRALMRGYGMSRYQWPVHFALLHNDCLWVYDEVQLMGAGLTTSTQLDAFRRQFSLARNSRSLWVSATLNRDWLVTVDMQPYLDSLVCHKIGERDSNQAGERLRSVKSLAQASVSLGKESGNKAGLQAHLERLRDLVLQTHDPAAQTLVILNRVDRAQQLFRLLKEQRPQQPDLLIHARFRANERSTQAQQLRKTGTDRIIVATQAIEAGVDISSKVLITELAPWASMVQRIGRCNRYGEYNSDGAQILWVNIEPEADALPYTDDALTEARNKLTKLSSASPQDLPNTDSERPATAVLRRKDLLDLFNTDPDLSGFDVDVSDYIRDSGNPGVQVFWRDFKEDPNQSGVDGKPEGKPTRDEVCPVSIGQAKALFKRKGTVLWQWDALDSRWVKLDREPRPGITLLLSAADGGYDESIGFDPTIPKRPVPVVASQALRNQDAYTDDWRAHQNTPVALSTHLGNVARQAEALCNALEETKHKDTIIRSGRWHDVGKAHKVFDATMHSCAQAPSGFLAKSPCRGRHQRPFFRHELASMLAWLDQHDGEKNADLIAYLIAAHHGKVRMSLRAMPTEVAEPGVRRFARGVWEGDILPALEFDGEHSDETRLRLALMEIGVGEQGPSWTERVLRLLDEHGPFELAWLETLVRLADWRASAQEQEES